ncbi:hypothetical protein HK101_005152 [Irineochytrium annulatum]|nr:hypothetical protein HK101_005152 [Irineochytrium annulatum]
MLLAGIILIGGGSFIEASAAHESLVDLGSTLGVGAIVVGCIVTIVSFLGCFGAANEKGMLLKTYFALLVFLVALELSVGIAAYVKRDAVSSMLETAWINSATANTTASQNALIQVETYFQCCGFHTVDSYAVPSNCAQLHGFTTPCYQSVLTSLQSSLDTIGGCGIAMGVIELVGIIFSAVLFVKIAARDKASQSLMNEAWRINREKIQYGYANYQYV